MSKSDTILSAKSLRYFLQLIETMNYTQAAQILGITQPALTQQVKKLERAIGAPLFGQMGKKLYLTEAGKEMEAAAIELLNTINGVISDIQEYTQSDKGNISIGILESVHVDLFYQFLRYFNKKYPEVTFTVDYFDRKELWHRLDSNMIDMAIMYMPDTTNKTGANFRHQYNHRDICPEHIVVLTHKDNVEAEGTYSVTRFGNRKWVAYPENYYLSRLMRLNFSKKIDLVTPFKIASTKEMIKIAENTDLDTYVDQTYYEAHKDEINLTPVYIKNMPEFTTACVYRRGKLDVPRMKKLLTELQIFLDNNLDRNHNFSKLLSEEIK